jgi:very-short-patch-repair endonuclease
MQQRRRAVLGARRETVHHALAELAARQHGVVSIRQLLGPLGYSASAVQRAAADGRLQRLYRGVYAVGHSSISTTGRCLAAVLAGGPGALLSHASAAWLWEISTRGPAPFDVTAPQPRRSRPPIRLHRARNLSAADREVIDRVPVTALPRTCLDLAGAVSRHNLERALDRAEQRGLFDLGPVETVLARNVGHPGAGRLRRALGIYQPQNVLRSALEARFLERVRGAGLPEPSANVNVGGYELDVYWSRERFVVELDVYETHGTHAAFENDRLRQEDLLLLGIGMTRITGPRFDREPQVVIERVARLLADRRQG